MMIISSSCVYEHYCHLAPWSLGSGGCGVVVVGETLHILHIID